MSLIDRFPALGGRLWRARVAVRALGVAALALFGGTLILSEGDRDEAWMMLSVTVALWAICLEVFARVFVDPPPTMEPGDRFLARVGKRLRRALYWITGLLVTAIGVVVVLFSIRAGGIAWRTLAG